MARQYVETFRKLYSPAAVGSGETVHLFNVKKGDRILWGDALARVSAAAATTSTIALQASGGAAGGLLAALTCVQTAGAIINLNGSDLAKSGGYLVTADGTVDAVYVTGVTPGATDPVWEITVEIQRREQIR